MKPKGKRIGKDRFTPISISLIPNTLNLIEFGIQFIQAVEFNITDGILEVAAKLRKLERIL